MFLETRYSEMPSFSEWAHRPGVSVDMNGSTVKAMWSSVGLGVAVSCEWLATKLLSSYHLDEAWRTQGGFEAWH